MTRKEKLVHRAHQYGRLRYYSAASAHGFQDGYRAAMRDMRKVVKAAEAEVPVVREPTLALAVAQVKQRNTHVAIMVRRFLRPLR